MKLFLVWGVDILMKPNLPEALVPVEPSQRCTLRTFQNNVDLVRVTKMRNHDSQVIYS